MQQQFIKKKNIFAGDIGPAVGEQHGRHIHAQSVEGEGVLVQDPHRGHAQIRQQEPADEQIAAAGVQARVGSAHSS